MNARSFAAAGLVTGCAMVADAQHLLWAEQFGTEANQFVFDGATDGEGGIIVVGEGRLTDLDDLDIFFARYDADGNAVVPIKHFGTPQGDAANRACEDGSGGVFMAGWTQGSLGGPYLGNFDGWVGRFDADGNDLWIKQISTTLEDWAWGVAQDGEGGVFVTGYTYGELDGPNAGMNDGFVARYDADGNQLWMKQFGTAGYEWPFSAAPDGAGGVFVGGHTWGDLAAPHAGEGDLFILHFDADGNQIGDGMQIGSSADEQFRYLEADGDGGVFACGWTKGDLDGPNETGLNDMVAAHYDASLNEVWMTQLGTAMGEGLHNAVVDGSGGVICSGGSRGDLGGHKNVGLNDAVVVRFGPMGEVIWIDHHGTSVRDNCWALATDGAGNVLAAGMTEGDLFGPSQGGRDAWAARYGCAADVNGDGDVNILDFVAFQALWQDMDSAADCDGSKSFNILDFVCFQSLFQNGCP